MGYIMCRSADDKPGPELRMVGMVVYVLDEQRFVMWDGRGGATGSDWPEVHLDDAGRVVRVTGGETTANQPDRLNAGDICPFTPQELLDAGFELGSVLTADRVNALLDRLRAEGGGHLPPHMQARLDAMARGEVIGRRVEVGPVTTPADPDDIVAFLRARYDDDARLIDEYDAFQRGLPAAAIVVPPGWLLGEPFDIGRQRAEVDAKRRIVDMYEQAEAVAESDHDWEEVTASAKRAGALLDVIRLGALSYADHPDYRSEWAVAK